MSTYDDASLVLIPSGYKNGIVFSQKPMDANGQLTFTRASSATRVASNGLIEKVRTNVALHSNDFSNAAWVKAALGVGLAPVVTANYTTDPFGGNNGWRLQCDLNGGTTTGDRSLLQQTIAGTIVPTTVSIYAKLNSAGTATFAVTNGSTDNVTITSTEWVRVSSVRTAAIGSYIFRVGLFGGLSSSTLDISIAFAQLETDDTATDYIPTTTAAVSVGPVSGLPRLDYLNSTCPKLLLEPSRTNDLQFSEQLDNAYWTKDGATITANNTISPDGYQSADLINYTGGNNRVLRSITKAASALTYTLSAYVKRNTLNALRLTLDGGSTSNEAEAIFNISTGTLTSTSVSGTFTNQSGSIVDVGNGWYRCRLTATTGTEVSIRAQFFGTTSESVYIYGTQLEVGAYASSYIPTLGASVTRVADAASKTGISSLIGQTEGTLFAEIQRTGASASNQVIFALTDGTSNNRIRVLTTTDTRLRFLCQLNGGSVQYDFTTTSLTFGATNKIAFAYKSGDIAVYLDGTQLNTSSNSLTISSTLIDLDLNGAAQATRHAQALLFKTRLTNAQLAELTSL
jgi:hypothetical protein